MSAPNRRENIQSLMDWIEYMIGDVPLERDTVDNALVEITLPHHQVHEGNFYTVSRSGTIASGTLAAFKLIIQPGVGTEAHFQGVINSKNSGWVELRENVTVVGGTLIVPTNNNRKSANLFGGTITYGGVVTGWGTLLQPRAIGSAAPGVRIGGESATRNEWVLNPAYKYLIWFRADNADTQVSLDAEMYEVTV